ncbi:MAG: N-acetyltransferase family protein [Oscillospiraceae bacterium]|nr:N-acetyltransferase family protein [Oscillospiraceae bacterium]
MLTGTLRPAVESELPALTEIYNEAIRNGACTSDLREFSVDERLPWFREHQDPAWPLLVFETGSRAAGYVYLTPYRKGREALRHVAEISYYVDFRCQGCGVGNTLLTHGIEEARRLGYQKLLAILLSCNARSAALLRKHGFTQWGCLPDVAELPRGVCSHLYYGLTL